MNALRGVGLIGLGMLMAFGLLAGAGAVLADSSVGDWAGRAGDHLGFMDGDGHHGVRGGMRGGHGHGMGGHHGDMPPECQEMMGDPEMMAHMMEKMHGAEPMSPEECQSWMAEHEVPAEIQAECLMHMAEHHPE